MSALVGAVVGAWVVAILALVLVLALTRRLAILADVVASNFEPRHFGFEVGDRLPSASGVSPEGVEIDVDTVMAGHPGLIAVVSSTCATCRDELPPFLRLAREARRGGWRALVVIVGDDDDKARGVVALIDAGIAMPLLQRVGGADLRDSLRVRVVPTFYAADADGRVMVRCVVANDLRDVVRSSMVAT